MMTIMPPSQRARHIFASTARPHAANVGRKPIGCRRARGL
jgi:hypothetical protein